MELVKRKSGFPQTVSVVVLRLLSHQRCPNDIRRSKIIQFLSYCGHLTYLNYALARVAIKLIKKRKLLLKILETNPFKI